MLRPEQYLLNLKNTLGKQVFREAKTSSDTIDIETLKKFLVSHIGPNKMLAEQLTNTMTLLNWRQYKGVYRIDTDLVELLQTTKILKLDLSHFFNLPEPTMYVDSETYIQNSRIPALSTIYGYFVSVAMFEGENYHRLVICFDTQAGLVPMCIPLNGQDIDHIIKEKGIPADIVHLVPPSDRETIKNEVHTFAKKMLIWALPQILYICAENAEYANSDRTLNKKSKKTKKQKNKKDTAAQHVSVHKLGYRLGASLRSSAYERSVSTPRKKGGSKKKCTHIRRAHWHSYWRGTGDKKELILRLMLAMEINSDTSEKIARVRDVE